jgi:protein-disulfide isomerase
LNQLGENLGAFSDSSLKSFAAALGLDQGEFDACLDSNRNRNLVNGDSGEAADRGVTSTPTIFINGQLIRGITAFEDLQPIIEAELNRQ